MKNSFNTVMQRCDVAVFRQSTILRVFGFALLMSIGVTCFTTRTAAQDGKGKSLPDIIEANSKAIGMVATLDAEGEYEDKFSCFVVGANGLLVTSYQPLSEAYNLEVVLPDGRKTREVAILAVDPRKDIAILKVTVEGLPVATLGDSERARPGESLVLLSRPMGTFPSATSCIVSAIRDSKRGLRIQQLSAKVNRNEMGSPAINERGEIIGMVAYYRLFNENLGYVIPSNDIRALLNNPSPQPFAEFVKSRKRVQVYETVWVEAKRAAIINKVRVNSFQMRDARVKWEFVNEVIGNLRAELFKELNAYGTTASEVMLADPFEVAEHRRMVASLTFTFQEIFAVGDNQDATLFPLTPSLLNAVSPSVFELGKPLTGKKGEGKGKISKVTSSYNLFTYLPLLLNPAYGTTNLSNAILLAALLSRLASPEEIPDLSLSVFYQDPSDNKEKEAESIWSSDAYTIRWGDIKNLKLWDVQEKLAMYKQQLRGSLKKVR